MNDSKKNILVVSQYFYPEQFRVNDLCLEWQKRGYQVTVVTGLPNYPGGKIYPGYSWRKKRYDNYNGIKVIRLPIVPRGNHIIGLAFNYLSYSVSGVIWALFSSLKSDYVFTYAISPLTQAFVSIAVAKRHKCRHYLYVQDLWPDSIYDIVEIKSAFIRKLLHKMVKFIYKKSDILFLSSTNFKEAVAKFEVPEDKIVYWPQFCEDFYQKTEKKNDRIPQDGIINITFTGNLGISQGLEILPNTALCLKGRNVKVRFNIIGDGRVKQKLMQSVKDKNCMEYFNFINKIAPEEIPEYLAASDAAFVSLRAEEFLSRTLPSKVQSYLACQIPLLGSANGEIQTVIREAECGLCSDAEDEAGLAANIEKFMQLSQGEREILAENGFKYFKQHFDKKMLFDQMDNFLEDTRNV